MTASVRQLKAQLSKYLRKANAGEDVVTTSRGRPFARLVPIDSASQQEVSGELLDRRLARIPGLLLGRQNGKLGLARPLKIRRGEKTLADLVIEERRAR